MAPQTAKAKKRAAFEAALGNFTGTVGEPIPAAIRDPLHGWIQIIQDVAIHPAYLESIHLAVFPAERLKLEGDLDILSKKHLGKEITDPWSAFLWH